MDSLLTYLAFVRKERRLLSFAVSFSFFSSFGQTFLLSLFVPYFLLAFDLSNASFGTLYSAATLTGAFALPWLGQWIDRIPLRLYSMYVAAGLLFAAILMAISWHIAVLFVALLTLRLSGQGLSSHTAQATMARFYDGERGKALSISNLGFPMGEAVLPIIIAAMLVALNWRTTWAIIAAFIALIFIPVLWLLIRDKKDVVKQDDTESLGSPSENYREILTDSRTLFLIPAILIPPFWVTGLFLYQVSVGGELGWSTTLIASAFIAFALARIVAGLISGPLIDRFSAQALFPFYLIPMIAGMAIPIFYTGSWTAFVYMMLIGATLGLSGTIKSALWAELFGTKMIGTVQSLFASIMVFSTALSPFLVGWMLDQSFSLPYVLTIAVVTSVVSALLSFRLLPAFQER
ncbi:MAG: MFS transporter [Balneolaceae bacterium]|nr:MFS transporter [Balneolaceae bacterium]